MNDSTRNDSENKNLKLDAAACVSLPAGAAADETSLNTGKGGTTPISQRRQAEKSMPDISPATDSAIATATATKATTPDVATRENEEALVVLEEHLPNSNSNPAGSNLHSNEGGELATDLPWWYPRCRGQPVFRGNREALGLACTIVGQASILIGTGAFIGPALVILAKEQAGCETEAPSSAEDVPDCNETVYGIKPSSLLTLMSSAVGLASAFAIPVGGAIVDYTPHRRLIGRVTSFLFSAIIATLAFLSEDSWFALALCFPLRYPLVGFLPCYNMPTSQS
jgi:hypothetical protein